jgi:hypothetical protein
MIMSKREYLKRLGRMFAEGGVPRQSDLLGHDGAPAEWRVTMLTGPIPNMGGRWLLHRKRFVADGGNKIFGCNILRQDLRWGHFKVGLAMGDDGKPATLIDYDVSENGRLMRRVCDLVRATPSPNVLIGRFHVVWFGRRRLLAYFILERLEAKLAYRFA